MLIADMACQFSLLLQEIKGGCVEYTCVFSVYSDHATTGTANSPSRPAANCPVFAVLTELVELAEAGSWSVNACKSKDMVFVQSDLCDKDSSYKPRDSLNASDFEAVQARAPQEQ